MPTFPPPPQGRPIDNPFTDEDGNVWVWLPSVGQWTTTEPVDKDRWDVVLSGQATTDGMFEPPEFFNNIRKERTERDNVK